MQELRRWSASGEAGGCRCAGSKITRLISCPSKFKSRDRLAYSSNNSDKSKVGEKQIMKSHQATSNK